MVKKLKLGYVNHNFYNYINDDMIEDLEKQDIIIDEVERWDELSEDKTKYDGFLLHPGIHSQKETLEEAVKTNLPIAIVTSVEEDYRDSDVPIFSYLSIDKITEYFNQA